jgi:PAS domain S-box-containing protein
MITVVCVSRDSAYLRQLQEVLEQEGDIRVKPVASGGEALASHLTSPSDAIVADMTPEDMDGITLLRIVRETRSTPFIILADAGTADREDDAITARTDFFFVKNPDTRGQCLRIARWIRLAVERYRNTTLLIENEARYHELVENANLIILKLDKDSKITFINEYARNYFGLKNDEVPEKLLADTIISAIGTDPVRDMGYFVRDIGTHSDRYTVRESEHVKKNGTRVWISWRNKPLLDRDNTIKGVISFGTDMTERRKAEQALFRANKKLNLLNSITRHDLLNELTVLGGYIGVTRELSNDKEMLIYIEHEKKATRAIRNMIKFTKDYQDIGLYRPQWQYLKNIVTLLGNTIDFSDVILRNELGRLEVYADPLFEKVIYSLLENAMRHGGQLTFIRLSYRIVNSVCVVICEDNGLGVADEDKEKIFLREYGKHTGFGLFLSREILSITGFSIRETGIHGNGARFEIYIPEGSFRENKLL